MAQREDRHLSLPGESRLESEIEGFGLSNRACREASQLPRGRRWCTLVDLGERRGRRMTEGPEQSKKGECWEKN
jgi:hypothetical protein